MGSFKVSVCQIKPIFDKQSNLNTAVKMITTAAQDGAKLIVLPEMFFYPYETDKLGDAAEEVGGATIGTLSECAAKNGIYLCTGTIAEKEGPNIYNTSYLLGPEGQTLLKYNKCHLYNVDLPNLRVQESEVFSYGKYVSAVETPFGKIGIVICYDIRFPEFIRKITLMGADILIMPGAFNTVSGPAHWHMTLRTRAVDNQIFVIAASPARNTESKYLAYGHSMVINPWGEILSEADESECIISAEIDFDVMKNIRARLPLLEHRRLELYDIP